MLGKTWVLLMSPCLKRDLVHSLSPFSNVVKFDFPFIVGIWNFCGIDASPVYIASNHAVFVSSYDILGDEIYDLNLAFLF